MKRYIIEEQEVPDKHSCEGCMYHYDDCCSISRIESCMGKYYVQREDKKNVIFVLKVEEV